MSDDIKAQLLAAIERDIESAFFGGTSTVAEELPTLNAKTLLRDMKRLMREVRRHNITFVAWRMKDR